LKYKYTESPAYIQTLTKLLFTISLKVAAADDIFLPALCNPPQSGWLVILVEPYRMIALSNMEFKK